MYITLNNLSEGERDIVREAARTNGTSSIEILKVLESMYSANFEEDIKSVIEQLEEQE